MTLKKIHCGKKIAKNQEQHSLCEYQLVFHCIVYNGRYDGKTKGFPNSPTLS